ncbi:FAD:protein FMN transferase [Anaeromyxobacter oryzae]|uniref:FAD:protein FMN transferase n=1 Tax=Anaeromyxobacter oryzae TaxID=2918170 RepID=UPI0020BDD4AD|nr:FAD:protein FMN transferase [Anaeromyxobacter oryzae]
MTAVLAALALAVGPVALVTETRPAMGSVATVTIVTAEPSRAAPGIEAAFGVFARVDATMNEWRPDSPLSTLNARAGRGWVALPGELCEALALAKAGAERTGGLFDPTWAALSDLWRFDGTAAAPPPDALLRARCPLVDHRGLELRPRAGRGCEARLARAGMRVGLGGLAKGWALDAAARTLRFLGYRDFLLQAGGDLYAAGRRGEEPWHVAIRDPRGGPLDAMAALDVSDRAFSTTGDYEHAFDAGGTRYHHVIDPRTCRPAPASRAATILARTAVDAEILGKAVFIEGGAAGIARAEAWGAAAVVVTGDGGVIASDALRARLRTAPDAARSGAAPR